MSNQAANQGCKPLSEMPFSEMLRVSGKSDDTEGWLDIHFIRPVGLMFALGWMRFNVHPNVVTILSILFGMAAGLMFIHSDLLHNILGVLLLMMAAFCDSSDGQMVRLTGKETLLGRILDNLSCRIWFVFVYVAIGMRLTFIPMPGTDIPWGIVIWVLLVVSGVYCHSPQASLADYYRQIHLWMKGDSGSLDHSLLHKEASEHPTAEGSPFSMMLHRFYHRFQVRHCESQELRTPHFQELHAVLVDRYGDVGQVPTELRSDFLAGSTPLLKFTHLLMFNSRAVCLSVACLINEPWLFPFFEIVVLTCAYVHMHKHHEELCRRILQHHLTPKGDE